MKNQGDVQNCSELENEVSVSSGNAHNNVPVPPKHPDALFTYIETLVKEHHFEEAEKAHRQFLNFVKGVLCSYVNRRLMYLSHHPKDRADLLPEVIVYLDENLILWFRDILNLLREETLHVLLHSAELSALAGKNEETDEFLLQYFFTADLRCGLTEKTQSDIAEVLAIGKQDIEARLNALTSKLSAEGAQKADSIATAIRSHMTDIISKHLENRLGMNNQGGYVQSFSELENEVSTFPQSVPDGIPALPEYPDALFTYIETLIKEQHFEEARKAHRRFMNFVKRALRSYVNRLMHLSHHSKNRAELPSEVITYLDENLILWFQNIFKSLRKETLRVLLYSSELSALASKPDDADEFLLQLLFTTALCGELTEKTQSNIFEILALGELDIEVRLDALIGKLSAFVSQKANDAVSYIKEGGIQRPMGFQKQLYRLLDELLTTLDIKSPSLENITNLDDFESKVNELIVTCRTLKQIQPGCKFPFGDLDSLQKTLSKLAAVAEEYGKLEMKHRFIRLTVAAGRLFLDLCAEDDPYLEVRRFLNRYNIIRTLSYDDVVCEENGGAAFYENEIEELYWLGNPIYERQAFPPKWKDYFISSLAIVIQELGVIKMKKGEASDTLFLRALELFESIPLFDEQDRPQNIEYHGNIIPHIAYCYYYLNDRDQALKWRLKITEIDEARDVTRNRAWEARQTIGEIYYEKGLNKFRNGVESYTDDFKKAEEWYLQAEEIQQIGRPEYARLGDLYAMQHRFEEAITIYESLLAMESEYPPSHKYLFDCYRFRRGWCLASMQHTEEAIEAFKEIVEIHQPEYQLYLILAYQWLTGLYKKASRWQEYTEARERWRECVEAAQAEGLPIGEEIIWDIDAECEKIDFLIDDREFAWAEREIENCLKQYPNDPRLHVAKATVLRHQNKIDEAFESLKTAYHLKDTPRNHAIAYLEMGRCYIHSKNFGQAAEYFLKASSLGSTDTREGTTKELAGALTLAACAMRNAGRYYEAIQLCKRVLEQIPNDAPALTCLARVYLSRGVKGNDERAIEILKTLIKSNPRDRQPVVCLCHVVEEGGTTGLIAIQAITRLLWEEGIEVREALLKGCQDFDLYDKSIISCTLECLKQYDLRFFRIAGDYLMKATIHEYFHAPTRNVFLNTLRTVLEGLLNSARPRIALVEYLASSKGAYVEYINKQIAEYASAVLGPLSALEKSEGRDFAEIIRQSILPEWRRILRSHCRSAVTAHFSGHDAPYDFIPELEALKNSFSAASQFLDVVWRGISRAEAKSYLMSGFLFRRFQDFLYELFSENGLEEHLQLAVNKEVAFQIEEHEGKLLLKIHYRFSEPEEETPLPPLTLEKLRMDFEKLEKWLPNKIEINMDTGRLMLTIPFPAVRSAGESLGVWQSFFDYVVVRTQDKTSLGNYYKQAARRFPQTAVQRRDVEALLDYAIAQMDAMFVAALDSASDRLRSPLHPIKNELLHLSDYERARMVPVEVWQKQKENWKSILYLLFQTVRPRFKRLNIETFVETNLRSFEKMYPHVSFEWAARETDYPIPLVEGCEPLLQLAVNDIVHNAVNGINAMSEVVADFQGRVLFRLTAKIDGVEIEILNNGSPEEVREAQKAMSTGLGWKNVEWVINRIHHGRATRDPVNEDGFRYRVLLYLPFEVDKED